MLSLGGDKKSVEAALDEYVTYAVDTGNLQITSYQWYFKNANKTEFTATVTTPTYSVKMSDAVNGRQVYCVITSADGKTLTSRTATMSLSSIIEGNIQYAKNDSGLTVVGFVVGYAGTDTQIVIPAQVNGYNVTEIGEGAFEGNKNLISVDLPDSITIIRAYAFKSCTNLREMK